MTKPFKCPNCSREYELADEDILAVSSELLTFVIFCPMCGKEVTVKELGPKDWSPEKLYR